MAKVDITFHPKWWHQNAGISFTQEFFENEKIRLEADFHMRQVLAERFAETGLFSRPKEKRPLLDSDLLAGEFLQAKLLGCEVLFAEDALPEVLCAHLSEEQIWNLCVPDLDENKLWKSYENQLSRLCEEYGYVDSGLDLYGVQNLAFALRGNNLFMDYYDNPELVAHLMQVCTETLLRVAERILRFTKSISRGVSSAVRFASSEIYVTSNCTVDLISPHMYEEYLLPWDSMLARKFGRIGIHHCGAHCERYVDLYKKVPNLCWLEAGAFSDFAAVRKSYRGMLNLRYSPRSLLEKTSEEIRKDVMQQFRAAWLDGEPDKTTMSCVGVDPDTPDENVKAFIAAVQAIQ